MNDLARILGIDENKAMSQAEYRVWIMEQEAAICKMVPSDEVYDRESCITAGFRLEHTLTPGLYVRELTMPAGSLVTSRIHAYTHPYLITKGIVSVYDGSQVVTLEAPHKGITLAGTKRILFTHTETTWITFHPTDITDINATDPIELLTCSTYEEYDAKMERENQEGSICQLSPSQLPPQP